MSLHLYNLLLQEAAIATSDDDIRAAIQQAGFLSGSGTASERISAETLDLVISGQWRLGDVLSRRHADEATSLATSAFGAVPLFDDATEDRNRGYYHVERVQANPAHQTTDADYQYTVALAEAGGHETHWRAVKTNVESISTGLAAGDAALVAIPHDSTKVRWYDPADGTEAATVTDTVTGDYAVMDRYDASEPSFTNPILLYEAPFGVERYADVVVYDDKRKPKEIVFASDAGGQQYDTFQYDTATLGGTVASATQWNHVYHTGYEFDGRPVVDTGRLRVTFDEAAGTISAERYDGFGWSVVNIDHSDYDLFDADVEAIGPSDVRVFTEWEKTDGSIDSAVLAFQRGRDDAVVRVPDGAASIDGDLESLLGPIASGQDDDATPTQALVRRREVSGQVA